MDIEKNEYEGTFDLEGNGLTELLKSSEFEKVAKRFNEGKETLDDLLNNYRHLKIMVVFNNQKQELEVVELKYYKKLIDVIKRNQNQLDKKDKQIEQYINMLATNDMLHVIEYEKKDKIINEMARAIYKCSAFGEYGKFKEDIIDYFTQKASDK